MDVEFRKVLNDKVGKELNDNNFYLVNSTDKYFIYHRNSDTTIEIVQIGKDKYETYITVAVSIVFLNAVKEQTNINYSMFNECANEDLEKISVDCCYDKYFLKGNFGNSFHYGDIYLALGAGIIGIKPNNKKPIGFRIKKFKSTTYNKLCDLIIKRLKKAYCWLERKRNGR